MFFSDLHASWLLLQVCKLAACWNSAVTLEAFTVRFLFVCFRSLGAAKKLIGAASIRRELQRLIQKKLTGEDDFLKDCSWGKVRTAARKLVPRRLGDGLNHTGFAQHCLNYFALALGWYGGALGSSAWQQKGWSALKSCLTKLLGSSGEKANPCQISGCI